MLVLAGRPVRALVDRAFCDIHDDGIQAFPIATEVTRVRLIDADKLEVISYKETEGREDTFDAGVQWMAELIDKQPTVEAVPVVHGKWIKNELLSTDFAPVYDCSECHTGTVMAAGQKFRGVGHMLGAAFVTRPALICRRMGSALLE